MPDDRTDRADREAMERAEREPSRKGGPWHLWLNSPFRRGWYARGAYEAENARVLVGQEQVRAIFADEVREAERNYEPSPYIDWLRSLGERVLAALASPEPEGPSLSEVQEATDDAIAETKGTR